MKPLFASILFTFCFVLTSAAKVVGIDVPYSIQISGYEDVIPLTNKTLFHWENKQSKKVPLNEKHFKHLQFKSLPNPSPNFGFIQHDVWFHFSVQNSQSYDQVIFLSINNPN